MANQRENNNPNENGSIFEIIRSNLSGLPGNEHFTEDERARLVHRLTKDITDALSNNLLKERLEILYNYEQKYLELTKAYKEEIKFAANLQEDIRKERSKFFSEILQDVHKTLEEVKMDKKATDLWISELVTSYTKSLDISAELAKDHVLDMMGVLRDTSRKSINEVSPEPRENK